MRLHNWQVIVENVGTVYSGNNGFTARSQYSVWVDQSKSGQGRAGFENVYLMKGEEIHLSYEYTHQFEYTDTFGGEANYSWVHRGKLRASSDMGAMRMAKRSCGINGSKGETSNFGDVREFRPYRSCTVLFVSGVER